METCPENFPQIFSLEVLFMTNQNSASQFYWPVSVPVRVLIVDDNPLFIRAVTLRLEITKYLKMVQAIGFTEDVGMQIEVFHPQVILLDMSKLDSTRLAMIKAARQKIAKLILIAVADQDTPSVRQSALLAGGDDFIPRAEVITRLIPTIQRQLVAKDVKPSL
jgi:DNA-binding NarL/FixJ family response regulator